MTNYDREFLRDLGRVMLYSLAIVVAFFLVVAAVAATGSIIATAIVVVDGPLAALVGMVIWKGFD